MADRFPPGPTDYLFGWRLVRQIRKDVLGFYSDAARRYGDVVFMQLGPFRDYTFNHPDHVRDILVTHARHFHKMAWQRKVLSQWNGNSLLLSEGDEWLGQRRLLQPAFQPQQVKAYLPAMVDCTRRLLDRWEQTLRNHQRPMVDVVSAMTDLTVSIIARTMFHADVEAEARELAKAVAVLSHVAIHEMTHPLRLPSWLPTPFQRRKRWAMRVLDDAIRGFVRSRRESGRNEGDVLSALLTAVDEENDGSRMNDEQVRDQAVGLFLAGHDTTAAALAWLLFLLAKNPDVETRVVQEIDDVLRGRTPDAEDLDRLVYTERVIKETLRLYPPAVGVFARQAVKDVEIAGYPIAKGSIVRLLSWIIHRDPRWFSDPEKFDPDRFAPGRVEHIHPYAYFPFGAGPRACIGLHFAMMEIKLITAMLLQRLHFELAPEQNDVELSVEMSLRPKGGLRMTLVPRKATTQT
ncbi:MAG: cytochrome P450 [Gemmatales bacterium]|nr:MAG: cytochrome P450 [Gemmatales bacterium]